MSDEQLVMRIPAEYGANITHDWDGLVISVPMPTSQTYQELGSAFVAFGVSLWGKDRKRREAAAASASATGEDT